MKIGDVTNQAVAQHQRMNSAFHPGQDFTRSSLSSPLTSSAGSWLTTVKNWVLFIPNALWGLLKKTIYFLTCCKFCGNTLSAKEKRDAIQGVLDLWGSSALQEREKAWTDMTSRYPYLENILIAAHVDIERRKAFKQKQANPEKVKEWNKQNSETVKKNVIEKIKECNVKVLEEYLKYLKPELPNE